MEQNIFHGNILPADIARELIAYFQRGNFRVQQVGQGDQITVQIATTPFPASGGHTALTVNIQKFEDGVSVSIGEQAWLGIAASLGTTALAAMRNPFALLGRLDDLAQDIESLQLQKDVWRVIESAAKKLESTRQLSDRLRRTVCIYCNTANPIGEPNCIACGAPMGDVQPETCPKCGYVVKKGESFCPNCGADL